MSERKVPHFRPSIDRQDIQAVTAVLKSGWLSNGPWSRKLEKVVARLSGKKYGVAVSSGTTALHLALLALGVKAGDEVVMPSYVCAGLAHATRQIGAIPVVVDVNEVDGNMSKESLREALTENTKTVIIPHMFGLMADIDELRKITRDIPVIEDCAMSIGAELNGKKAGSFGDISIFSFYATKMTTGGEGGVLTTSDKKLRDELEDLREYDKKFDDKIRYNYKLSDLNAALATSQLEKLPKFIKKRQEIAKIYLKEFASLPLLLPQTPPHKIHTFYRLVVRTPKAKELRAYLKKHGVSAGFGVVGGIHRILKSKGGFPVANKWLDTTVSLPIYPAMTNAEARKVAKLVRVFYTNG